MNMSDFFGWGSPQRASRKSKARYPAGYYVPEYDSYYTQEQPRQEQRRQTADPTYGNLFGYPVQQQYYDEDDEYQQALYRQKLQQQQQQQEQLRRQQLLQQQQEQEQRRQQLLREQQQRRLQQQREEEAEYALQQQEEEEEYDPFAAFFGMPRRNNTSQKKSATRERQQQQQPKRHSQQQEESNHPSARKRPVSIQQQQQPQVTKDQKSPRGVDSSEQDSVTDKLITKTNVVQIPITDLEKKQEKPVQQEEEQQPMSVSTPIAEENQESKQVIGIEAKQQQSEDQQPKFSTQEQKEIAKIDAIDATLQEYVNKITILAQNITLDPNLEKHKKELIVHDEMLTRELIKLDMVETFGNEQLRTIRKNEILKVQRILDIVDSLKKKLQNLELAPPQQQEQQEHEQQVSSPPPKEEGEVEGSTVSINTLTS